MLGLPAITDEKKLHMVELFAGASGGMSSKYEPVCAVLILKYVNANFRQVKQSLRVPVSTNPYMLRRSMFESQFDNWVFPMY